MARDTRRYAHHDPAIDRRPVPPGLREIKESVPALVVLAAIAIGALVVVVITGWL